jgi:hypothetical protein
MSRITTSISAARTGCVPDPTVTYVFIRGNSLLALEKTYDLTYNFYVLLVIAVVK